MIGIQKLKHNRDTSQGLTSELGTPVWHPIVWDELGAPVAAPKCQSTEVAFSSMVSRLSLSRFREFDSCLGGGVFLFSGCDLSIVLIGS